MAASVVSEAARLAINSDVMVAVGAATVLAAHGLGLVVHRRAVTPAMTWKQSLVAAAYSERLFRSFASWSPAGRVEGTIDRVAVRQVLRVTGIAGGLLMGLMGVALVTTSGHVPNPELVLVSALLVSGVAVWVSVASARSSAVRNVLSRRGMQLMSSAVFREATGVGAMVVPVLVVAHTAGISGMSMLEVSAVALATRLVIAAVPVAAGLGVADVTMVAGLAWMDVPVPVGIAAVIIWRVGSVTAVLVASVIALSTAPVTVTWDAPSKDGAGRRLHRAVFSLMGTLPLSLRSRARGRLFDMMFAMSPDPWGYGDMPYERRKQWHLLDAVGPEAQVIIEVGCAEGHNLLALGHALPSAVIIGTDVSSAAVRIASDRTHSLPNIRIVNASDAEALVAALPGPVDCIVLAEVLYYLGGSRAMAEALARLRPLMSSDARVVMVHGSADAQVLHERAASALGLALRDQSQVSDVERPFKVAVAGPGR